MRKDLRASPDLEKMLIYVDHDTKVNFKLACTKVDKSMREVSELLIQKFIANPKSFI